MIKAIELFGGIGAATQALKRQFGKENINIVDYVELDKNAVASYNAINGTSFVPTDINNVDMKAYPEVDLVIAGWPCQDYSIAGKGLGLEGTRSSLILLTIAKIKEMENKPKHILLENVKGLLQKSHIEDLEYIKNLFDELGYNWDQALLNSKYFNVPQSRERVFMFLTRKDLPKKSLSNLLNEKTINTKLNDILEYTEPFTEQELSKINMKNYTNFIVIPRNSDGKVINGFHNRLWKADKYVGTLLASAMPKIVIKGIKPSLGKQLIENIENIENKKEGFISLKVKSGWNDAKVGITYTQTLRASNNYTVIRQPQEDFIYYRKINPKEAWRLMGFKDENFIDAKNAGIKDSQLLKQAGNSIVVNVLEAIFKETLKGGQ